MSAKKKKSRKFKPVSAPRVPEPRPEPEKTAEPPAKVGRSTLLVIASLLLLLVVVVYGQVGNFDFVNYDDNMYVTDNFRVQRGLSPEFVRWSFSATSASNWHPLTWISHALDVELFGVNAGPHHLVNAAFHGGNTLLLFAVLFMLTGAPWRSAAVAALFAVHPLHVESVAWISERKDVLSTFFWLLTMLFYTRYVRRPVVARYIPALLCFALGLMAKPMLVTLPAVLLLVDFWPLGRFSVGAGSAAEAAPSSLFGGGVRGLVIEKLPFLGLSVISSMVTLSVQSKAMALSGQKFLAYRLSNAILSYVKYVAKTFRPLDLSVFYPLPSDASPSPAAVLPALLFLVAVSALALWWAKRRGYLFTGWFWFLGTLVPVIGLVQVGGQAMADRYTYVPLIGFFIAIVWGAAEVQRKIRLPLWVPAAFAAAVLISLTWLSWSQVGRWRDSSTLFRHALAVNPENYMAYNNLGAFYGDKGEEEEAVRLFRKAIDLLPSYAAAHLNYANSLAKRGDVAEAIGHYEQALKSEPNLTSANSNMGLALASVGRHDEAITYMKRALARDPDSMESNYNMGLVMAGQGKLKEAAIYYRKALLAGPGVAEVHNNLGIVLAQTGDMAQAIEHFRRALEINPSDAVARKNLQRATAAMGTRSSPR